MPRLSARRTPRRGRIGVLNGPATLERPGPWPNLYERSDVSNPTPAATSCTIPDCTAAGPIVRGMCGRHYARWKRHGDPNTVKVKHGSAAPETLKRKSRGRAQQAIQGDCYLHAYGFCSPKRRVVHHVNENPLDNRPQNLRVLCDRHHILVHRSDFDLENPDHSRYFIRPDGTIGRWQRLPKPRRPKGVAA